MQHDIYIIGAVIEHVTPSCGERQSRSERDSSSVCNNNENRAKYPGLLLIQESTTYPELSCFSQLREGQRKKVQYALNDHGKAVSGHGSVDCLAIILLRRSRGAAVMYS